MANVIAVFVVLSALSLVACDRNTEEFAHANQTPHAVLKAATDHMALKGTTMANYDSRGTYFRLCGSKVVCQLLREVAGNR
jgi:hypothetical protein